MIVPVFERRAPGLYHNSAVVIRRGRGDRRHLPQDAHPGRPGVLREVLLHAGRPGLPVFRHARGRIGTLICWDQWYPEAAGSRRCAGQASSSTRRPSAGIRREKAAHGAAQRDAWMTVQRGHAIANGVYVAASTARGWRSRIPTGGHRVLGRDLSRGSFRRRDRLGARPSAEEVVMGVSTRRASRRSGAAGPSCATGAVDAYAGSTRDSSRVNDAPDSDAGRVGAPCRHLDRLAAQSRATGRGSSPRYRGCTARS